jgi:hypothetical protein
MAKNKRAKPVRTVPVGRNAVQRQRLTPGLRNTTIDGAPVTYAQWKRGDLLRALTAKPTKRAPGGATAPGATRTLIRPPAGSYDPNLDVQERAAKRGYRYTTEDLTRGSEREATDFGLGQENLGRQRGDVQRQYGENLSDLLKARARGSEDYQSNLQTIARNFSQLGNQQAQRGREAGLEGGYALQAARKRAANEAITRAPVDTGYKRFSADSTLDETRLGQAQQRSFDEIDRSGGQLAESLPPRPGGLKRHRRARRDRASELCAGHRRRPPGPVPRAAAVTAPRAPAGSRPGCATRGSARSASSRPTRSGSAATCSRRWSARPRPST